jgi:hypothetical protein
MWSIGSTVWRIKMQNIKILYISIQFRLSSLRGSSRKGVKDVKNARIFVESYRLTVAQQVTITPPPAFMEPEDSLPRNPGSSRRWPSTWGYTWATISLGDINTETWSSRLVLDARMTTLLCKNNYCCEMQRIGIRMQSGRIFLRKAIAQKEPLCQWWWWLWWLINVFTAVWYWIVFWT